MKNLNLLKFCLITLFFIFTACESEDIDESILNNPNVPETFSQYFGNDISRDFMGRVIDVNDNPISGTTISIGSKSALTDNNGVFIIKEANVKERFAYIKAEKEGYIHGSRSLAPSEGINKVNIMLLEENVIGTVNSGTSATVSLPNGSSVSFDGNFVKPDGTAYSGSVDVILHHLDPTDEDMIMQMPGMLYAENQDGAERMLQSMGMLAVELKGTSGEDLNLAEGSTSEIKIPVDTNILSSAPSTIPLWYFDEDYGYWKEEGQATLQGNAYVGEVSHFSFWNCDVQAEASNICITVLSDNGNPVSNLNLSITSVNYGSTSGQTNANGVVCGFVPSGEGLLLSVSNNEACGGESIFNETIGPFSGDDIVTINLPPLPDEITETITGTFNACDGNPVVNGYVELIHAGVTHIEFIDDGNLNFTFLNCEDDDDFFSVIGYDYDNLQTTGEINFTFTSPTTNIATITACNSVTEFASIAVDSVYNEIFLGNFEVNVDSGIPSMYISNFQEDNACLFVYGVYDITNPVGSYDEYLNNGQGDTGFSLNYEGCFPFDTSDNNIIYNVTSFGNPGEYIDFNISGTVQDTLNVTRNVTGTIHVLRDQ